MIFSDFFFNFKYLEQFSICCLSLSASIFTFLIIIIYILKIPYFCYFLHCLTYQIWKNQQWTQDWKGQFSFQSQRKVMPKNVQTIALISHASKVMLTILQARDHQYVSRELPDVQVGYRKNKGTRD